MTSPYLSVLRHIEGLNAFASIAANVNLDVGCLAIFRRRLCIVSKYKYLLFPAQNEAKVVAKQFRGFSPPPEIATFLLLIDRFGENLDVVVPVGHKGTLSPVRIVVQPMKKGKWSFGVECHGGTFADTADPAEAIFFFLALFIALDVEAPAYNLSQTIIFGLAYLLNHESVRLPSDPGKRQSMMRVVGAFGRAVLSEISLGERGIVRGQEGEAN